MAHRIANFVWLTLALMFALTIPTLSQTGAPKPDQTVVNEAKWEEFWRTDVRLRSKMPMESIIITGRRQLFIDNYVIEHSDNLSKVLHQPTKDRSNPVLRPEWPWEMGTENVNNNIGYTNVIYDHEEGIFKVWYNIQQYGVAYATSQNGLTWEKPALGIVDFQGSSRNNLVISARGIDSPTIIKDTFERDPRRRYKYFAKHNSPQYGMYVGYSADGIHWIIKEEPVLTTRNDPALNDRPTLMQDLEGRRYIAFTKREIINPFGKGDYGFLHRSRAVSLSRDFEKWSDPVLTLRPDDMDPHDLQIYGLVGFNYEGLYLGLMDMFWSGDKGPRERTIDIQLALSRDGEVWWRAGDRKTFLPVGPEGTWDRFRVHPANSPPIRKGEELLFFFNGAGVGRHGSRGTLPGAVPEHRRREPWLAPGHPEDEALKDSMGGTGMGIAPPKEGWFCFNRCWRHAGHAAHQAPGIFGYKSSRQRYGKRRWQYLRRTISGRETDCPIPCLDVGNR